MKKYKVNGKIIDAKTELEAIKKYNDSIKDSYIIETVGETYSRYLQNDNKFGFNKDEAKKLTYNEAESLLNSYKKANPDLKLKIVTDSVKDSLDASEEVVEDAIYWVKKSGKELTINNILKQIDEDMKGFLGGNQSRIIAYLKNEKHIKDSVKDAQVLIRYNTNAQANEAIRILKRKGINADLQFDTTISIHNAKGYDVDYAYENTEGIAENQKFYGINDSKQYIQKGLAEFVVNDTHKAYAIGSVRGFNEDWSKSGLEQHVKLAQESVNYCKDLERQGFRQDNNKAYLKDSDNYMIIDKDYNKYIYYFEWLPENDGRKFNYYLTDSTTKADKFSLNDANNIILGLKKLGYNNYTTFKYTEDSVKDAPFIPSQNVPELKRYAKKYGYEWEEVLDGFNSRTKREGMNIEKAIEDLKEKMMTQKSLYDSLKDANIDILNKLIVEEEKAINDYKSAIENDPDEYASSVYKHILNEEIEHLEELKKLINGKIEDSANNAFYTQRAGVYYVYIDYKLVGKFSSKEDAKEAGYDLDGSILFNANYISK